MSLPRDTLLLQNRAHVMARLVGRLGARRRAEGSILHPTPGWVVDPCRDLGGSTPCTPLTSLVKRRELGHGLCPAGVL